MLRRILTALAASSLGVALAVLAAEPPEVPVTHAQIIAAVASDLYSVREVVQGDQKALVPVIDPATAKTIRYIYYGEYTAAERAEVRKVIDGHLNLLSRRSGIKTTVQVTPWLLRIDLNDYGEQFAKAWERMGLESDWVFHSEDFTDELEEYEEKEEHGFWTRNGVRRSTGGGSRQFPDEVWETTRTVVVKKKRLKKAKGIAGWVTTTPEGKSAFENIQTKTGGTDLPVAMWSQFFWESAKQEDRKVGYYGFLGIKNLADYERLIGVVKRDIDPERLAEVREVTGDSTVTNENVLRRIIVLNAIGGHYFLTQDSNQDKLKKGEEDKGNPLFEHGDDYIFQALEGFGNLSNGLPATVLTNDKGVLQDKAPDFIAGRDTTAPGQDDAVHVNLSCVRCHRKGGMQDVYGWVKNVLNAPPNELNGRTPEERKKLASFYVERRLEPAIKTFRERTDTACLEATGLKWEQFSDAYAKVWAGLEAPVTVDRAARELGVTTEAYRATLLKLGGSVHPNLAGHRRKDPFPVPRSLWIKAYPWAADAMRGVIRPFKVEVRDK